MFKCTELLGKGFLLPFVSGGCNLYNLLITFTHWCFCLKWRTWRALTLQSSMSFCRLGIYQSVYQLFPISLKFFPAVHVWFFSARRMVDRALQGVTGFRLAAHHSLSVEEIVGRREQHPLAGKFEKNIGVCDGFANERVNKCRVYRLVTNL